MSQHSELKPITKGTSMLLTVPYTQLVTKCSFSMTGEMQVLFKVFLMPAEFFLKTDLVDQRIHAFNARLPNKYLPGISEQE